MMQQYDQSYDVVVVGGGPAGSTTAALIAEKGHRVLVVERAKFPRFHIGESLMPESWWVFERLGVIPKLNELGFVRKHSVQFVTASGRDSAPFYFEERKPHDCSVTWQVERADFDLMMLDNAAEKGAIVWQEANVVEVLTDDATDDDLPAVRGVVVQRKGEAKSIRISARVVVDATGMNTMLARKFNIRRADPKLRKASFFAHYKRCAREPGKNGGATLVISTRQGDGWFWYIPLRDDVTSVGVVADIDRLVKNREGTPEQILDEEIKACPGLTERMKDAERVSPVHVMNDFSYRASRCAGEGWALVGDAFGFLDPMYSSGVFLALKNGELVADAINEALDADDMSALQLSKWGDTLSDGMTVIRKLVYAFYAKEFSFGRFIKAHPEQKDEVTAILVGEVFHPQAGRVFEPMSEMAPIPAAIPLERPAAARAMQDGDATFSLSPAGK